MPHIRLEPEVPGIRAPMVFRPETAGPLRQLAEILLRSEHTLTPGEREPIATCVSSLNDYHDCQTVHGYAAAAYHNGDDSLVESRVKRFRCCGRRGSAMVHKIDQRQGGKRTGQQPDRQQKKARIKVPQRRFSYGCAECNPLPVSRSEAIACDVSWRMRSTSYLR